MSAPAAAAAAHSALVVASPRAEAPHAKRRVRAIQSVESNLGDFIANAYLRWTSSDVALVNSGSIRSATTYGPGRLTIRDVLSKLSFENQVVKIEVTGSQIRAALEHSVSAIDASLLGGRFPQISGMTFVYIARRPPGSRGVEVMGGGRALDDKKVYTLATNSYLATGGDGYTMFRGSRFIMSPEEGPVEAAVLITAIQSHREIAPRTDGCIERLDGW